MHLRKRHIQQIMAKRARLFPVLGIVGPRQVGKTTFLKDLWKNGKGHYVTLDKYEVVKRAKRAPESFLLAESNNCKTDIIVDEVQKVPQLFDSMKAILDERRRVGMFTVSGSVAFSNKAGVRESLAGRMALCRLYPFTLAELGNRKLQMHWTKAISTWGDWKATDREIYLWMKRGGMPLFCALRNETERKMVIEGWLEAVCHRDLKQLREENLEGDVALEILQYIARYGRVNQIRLAQEVGVSRAVIHRHLLALKDLFLVYELQHIDNRRAISEYVIFDCGVLSYLAGQADDHQTVKRALRTLLVNEIFAQFEYGGYRPPQLYCYRSRGGAEIDLVLKDEKKTLGIGINVSSDISSYSLRGLKSFLMSHKRAQGVVVAPVTENFVIDGICVVPWKQIG